MCGSGNGCDCDGVAVVIDVTVIVWLQLLLRLIVKLRLYGNDLLDRGHLFEQFYKCIHKRKQV